MGALNLQAVTVPSNSTPTTSYRAEIDALVLDQHRIRSQVEASLAAHSETISQKLAEVRTQAGTIIIRQEQQPERVVTGVAHKQLARVVQLLDAGLDLLLVGPTQCGKTHLAKQASEVLGLDFSANSCAGMSRESEFFGSLLPIGEGGKFEYIEPEFARIARIGGLALLDEMDAMDASLGIKFSSLLANGYLNIPAKQHNPVLIRHPNFRCIGAANTWGNGSDAMYVGRNQLDAATLARFVLVEIGYDEELELQLFPAFLCSLAKSIRQVINTKKLRRVCSTGTIKQWAKMEATGLPLFEILHHYFLGWSEAERKLVLDEVKLPSKAEAKAVAKDTANKLLEAF